MTLKVVITDLAWPEYEVERKILSEIGAEVVRADCKTPEEVLEVGRDADALLVSWAPIERKVIEQLSRCRIISRYGVGVEMIDVEAATEHGITVVANTTYCTSEVAEQALAFLLAGSRKLAPALEAARRGVWRQREVLKPILPLAEQTLGILGLGRIGSRLATWAAPLVGRIIAHDLPSVEANPPGVAGVEWVSLDRLLGESDYLSLHCPLNTSTRHLIDAEALRKMKPTAFLINTARGPIVEEKALVAALQSGQLAGAALDVYGQEPLPVDHPFLHLPNVLATPHTAWYSERAMVLLVEDTARAVVKFFKGEPVEAVNTPVANRSTVS